MIDCLSIDETDKVIHTMKSDIVKLVVEIESFDMSSDEFDKEIGSSDGLQLKQADLRRKSIQKFGVHLKLFQFHIVDVHVIE
ncbi:hypothetical protein Tco_0859110 [Tanacetum coccineum]|uniref:Uncharacterized protein n=1 Tax=Tanacetum coccineum TaxID=301880 RepID=A0ABQ5BC18_9ASTR